MKLKDFTFIFVIIALALFDALFGGALAAILQHEGWKQRINDIWQAGFGVICLLSIILLARSGNSWRIVYPTYEKVTKNPLKRLYRWFKTLHDARWQAIYLLAMLLVYAEDLLFYPVLWALNEVGVTSLISGGYEYDFPPYLWPWSLSGWIGFVTRLFFGETIKLPTVWAMILTVGTLAGILWHIQFRKDKQR